MFCPLCCVQQTQGFIYSLFYVFPPICLLGLLLHWLFFLLWVQVRALAFLIPFTSIWIEQSLDPLVLTYCPIINGHRRLFWWNFVSWQCRRHTGLPPPSLEHGSQAVTLSSVQPLWIQLHRYFISLCLVTSQHGHPSAAEPKCPVYQTKILKTKQKNCSEKKKNCLIWKRWPIHMQISTFL